MKWDRAAPYATGTVTARPAVSALQQSGPWSSLKILVGLWERVGSVLGRNNLHKEADPAKKAGEVFTAFPDLRLFSVFLTNNAFIKAMPNFLVL